MRVPSSDPIVTSLQTLVVVASSAYILLYAVLVSLRISYPFELEWLEGAMVDHVRVVLEGQPLYARPSLAFTPLTYTPGYVYAAAGLSHLIGLGFLPLRLISVVASAVLLALIVKFVTHETGNWRSGVMAAGLFAALYGWTGGWLDLARNDSLFLALAMASVFVARRYPTPVGAAVAALLISLSFLTKQTGLIIAVPLALWCAAGGWRRGFAFAGVMVPLVAGTTWLFDRHFEGWYVYYIYGVPRQHPVSLQSIVGFWRYDLFNPLPIALGGAVTYLAWRLTRRRERPTAVFYLLVAAGFVAGAWISRLHSLSFVNVVLPAHLVVAVIFSIGVHDLTSRLAARPGRTRVPLALLYAACLLQLVRLAYAPARLVPTNADIAAGERWVATLRTMPGAVFAPFHGYLPSLAGKRAGAHAVPMADVIRGTETPSGRQLAQELAAALEERRFDVAVGPAARTPVEEWLPIASHYEPAGPIVEHTSAFWRRERTYVPR